MAGRPNKVGLDYFELDCLLDDNIKLIQAEFGLKGFAVVVKLYQKIYGDRGYYCEWSNDVLLLFMTENFVNSDSKNLINDIISACIRRNIFSRELFEKYHILTSRGIQKRYINATYKREMVELKKEYLLIDVGKNRKNVTINSISDRRNKNYDVRNSQSKVKESKGKNKETLVGTALNADATMKFPLDCFEMKCVEMIIKSNLENFPNSKVPVGYEDKKKWAIEFERMKRLDKRSEEEIWQALDFATSDSFWKTNIRSGKKFREKFETLFVQSLRKIKKDKRESHEQGNPLESDRFSGMEAEKRAELESLGIIEGQSLSLGNATEEQIRYLQKCGVL